jgi:hypothetical protein
VQLTGAKATIENSVLHFPKGTVHEPVYHLVKDSSAVFINDSVDGYGRLGKVGFGSTVKITGGHWVSATGGSAGTKQGRKSTG